MLSAIRTARQAVESDLLKALRDAIQVQLALLPTDEKELEAEVV